METLPKWAMLVSLAPVPALAMVPNNGHGWAVVALIYMTIFAVLVDAAVQVPPAKRAMIGVVTRQLSEITPIIQGVAHLVLLPTAVLTLCQDSFDLPQKALIFAAFSVYFGIFSTSNAHELIHSRQRLPRHLGKWVFISLLFGHHFTAHLAVHHRFVASPNDPNTARLNEGFYRFFVRAWLGSFQSGLAVEVTRLATRGRPKWHPANPYVIYLAGGAATIAAAGVLAGPVAIACLVGLAGLAQVQLLLSDYVQHYGLVRRTLASGQLAPVTLKHSWNAGSWFSAALMVNAPRHSDHHTHPQRSYATLVVMRSAPTLPYSLPIMSMLALAPPVWRRLMNPEVARWRNQQGDAARATPANSRSPFAR